jgi:hypothetical protein
MVWYSILIVAAIALAAWFVRFVRTPSFRHRFGSEGKDPGQAGSHARGSMLNADRDFRKND